MNSVDGSQVEWRLKSTGLIILLVRAGGFIFYTLSSTRGVSLLRRDTICGNATNLDSHDESPRAYVELPVWEEEDGINLVCGGLTCTTVKHSIEAKRYIAISVIHVCAMCC